MSNIGEESLKKHEEWKGKISTVVNAPLKTKHDLMLAYTPGVAQPCLEIQKDYSKSWDLTRRWNTVAVITDGTAVLGLGDIGPEAGMPVMEGKCALMRQFGGIDAFPICVRSKDPEEIIRTVYLISGSFGGINLEDISAPRCFEIETKLKEICDIPVFHDDQHGTAIITAAATINALKIVNKNIKDIKIVFNGAGAAGIAIGKFLMDLGATNVIWCDRSGAIYEGREGLNDVKKEIAKISNPHHEAGKLADVIKNADVFIGVSSPKMVTEEMVKTMAKDPILFPCANPIPEITYEEAIHAGAKVVGTGSSQYPNQINNLLVFPGVFRGALDARASQITIEMKKAACFAIANAVGDKLSPEYIIPDAIDESVHAAVAKAVYNAAVEGGVSRIK